MYSDVVKYSKIVDFALQYGFSSSDCYRIFQSEDGALFWSDSSEDIDIYTLCEIYAFDDCTFDNPITNNQLNAIFEVATKLLKSDKDYEVARGIVLKYCQLYQLENFTLIK